MIVSRTQRAFRRGAALLAACMLAGLAPGAARAVSGAEPGLIAYLAPADGPG